MFCQQVILIVLGLAITSVACADDDVCDGITNNELLICGENGYRRADKALNEAYKALVTRLSDVEASQLKRVQRKWIRFKEIFCRDIYDETYPGKEAGIVYTGCLWHITEGRTMELERITNALSGKADSDYLSKMLDAFEAAGHDREATMKKYASQYSDDKDWTSYINASCDFTGKLLKDDRRTCVLRLNIGRVHED
jgi:uncharacterized protein YecT (DUF1311 family)